MAEESKLKKLVTTSRKPGEAEAWVFSLVPISVAFAFYTLFIVTSDIEEKGFFMAVGAVAGLVGLESYWIMRGWRNNHGSTVIMGILGIAITLGLFAMYMSFSGG
jgi:hypothetical protein